jgi:integrase
VAALAALETVEKLVTALTSESCTPGSGGDWTDPAYGQITFTDYSGQWMKDRVLKGRTPELYDGLLRNHLLPTFGGEPLVSITLASVRRWRKERLNAGPAAARPFGPVTVAKAYRLLHAITETAVDDELIRRNPCRIDGAGQEDADERPVIPLPVVFAIANTLPARYRALVLLATFAQLRLGELAGLTRDRIDLDRCEVRITDAKSTAGNRTVTFPAEIVPELRYHLEHHAAPGRAGLDFIGPKGGMLRRNNFNPIWRAACIACGVPDAHFHDTRHTGGTLAAHTGATIKELMARLGHSSPRAAMIYQHATRERDKVIADGLGQLVNQARPNPSGPLVAQPPATKIRKRSKKAALPAERATVIETA